MLGKGTSVFKDGVSLCTSTTLQGRFHEVAGQHKMDPATLCTLCSNRYFFVFLFSPSLLILIFFFLFLKEKERQVRRGRKHEDGQESNGQGGGWGKGKKMTKGHCIKKNFNKNSFLNDRLTPNDASHYFNLS